MSENSKKNTLIFLLLAAVMTVMLAAGLPRLEFQPGLPLPRLDGERGAVEPSGDSLAGFFVSPLLKALVIFIIVVLVLNLFILFFKRVSWKDMVTTSLQLGFVALLIAFLLFIILNRFPGTLPVETVEIPIPIEETGTFQAGAMPPWLFWLVGIGLAVSVALVGMWLFASARKPVPTIQRLGLEAEKARLALLTGLDLKSVIVQCYREMSLALWQAQGIERTTFMTAREFESLLTDEGYPSGPIHQLTRLFEAVRYGRWQPDAGDEQKAIDCLEAIVKYSREQAQAS